jgi:hypothetical protein
MTAITREELDAKLDAVRSENLPTAAELQREMHGLCSDILTQFVHFRGDLVTSTSAVNVAVAGVEGKVASLSGDVNGLKNSISMFQWIVVIVLAIAAAWIGYEQLKAAQSAPAPASIPVPIVIQIPSNASQQGTQLAPLPPTTQTPGSGPTPTEPKPK